MVRLPHLLPVVVLLACFPATAQLQFDPEHLAAPKRYGSTIAAQLKTQEVFEFRDTIPSTLFLKNGFRSSAFVNGDDWLKLRDSVEVYRIDVVYSKYPLRKGTYAEIYPLLCSRLDNLFAIDGGLNDAAIQWNRVLQTHCVNDKQVDGLPHGVLIWYRPQTEETPEPATETAGTLRPLTDGHTAGAEQSSTEELKAAVSYIMESDLFNDTLKTRLKGKKIDEQRRILIETLEQEINNAPDEDLSKIDKIKRDQYIEELGKFTRVFATDNVVSKVLSRHPEWQHIYIVNDWTGSMYGYGGQVLQWHILNLETSGIEHLTLFNDGDQKPTSQKDIGTTDGIYAEKANNIEKTLKLFQLVMMNGCGGDGPENDIEAILDAIKNAPDSAEIVLIADNYACIRDIELADRIPYPVRVIVCGYTPEFGINPNLVYLAKVTNGGLYTIEDDIENLQVGTTQRSEVTDMKDSRFKLAKLSCDAEISSFYKSRTTIPLAGRRKIHSLDLSRQELDRTPKRLRRLSSLYMLNLSGNKIKTLSTDFTELTTLKQLNLSDNYLGELPKETARLKYLLELDASGNSFTTWETELLNFPFLVKLDLSGNSLTEIEKLVNLRRLVSLDLSHNRLSVLPRSFQSLKSLKTLNLSHNAFTTVPQSICNLRKVEELDLRGNKLTVLPPEMSGMKALRILHLEDNSFSEEEMETIRARFPKAVVYF